MTDKTIYETFDDLPDDIKGPISAEFADWYNDVLQQYNTIFASKSKSVNMKVEAIMIFVRETMLWWHGKKPVIKDDITYLDMFKTRVCDMQITEMSKRLDNTGLEISDLELNEHLQNRVKVV